MYICRFVIDLSDFARSREAMIDSWVNKKMIISFNGDHGAGKSTIARMLAEKLNYPYYYMGQIFRDMAKKRGITLEEFQAIREKDPKFDNDLEKYIVDLSKKYANFVIESRTAWHFIPTSLKIYIKVTDTEGAKRIFKELRQENKRNEANGLNSEEKVLENINRRRDRDNVLYKNYYGINIRDERNYDFILDTTNLSIEEAFQKVLEFVELKMSK